MNPRFRISVGSEVEYEDLIGELYYDDQIVVLLAQERGFGAMDMQLFGPSQERSWSFKLIEFQEALEALKTKLWDLRRTDPGLDPEESD
jgi:hypothetical protein